jgi:hypothetical protein
MTHWRKSYHTNVSIQFLRRLDDRRFVASKAIHKRHTAFGRNAEEQAERIFQCTVVLQGLGQTAA